MKKSLFFIDFLLNMNIKKANPLCVKNNCVPLHEVLATEKEKR